MEERGELGVLWEPLKPKTEGVGRWANPSSSSDSSATPNPPYFRHRRATRSAHSKMFTKRRAPASSIASGCGSLNTRMVGSVVEGNSKEVEVAMMSNELERCLENSKGSSSFVEDATE